MLESERLSRRRQDVPAGGRGRGPRIVLEAAENRVRYVDFDLQHFRFSVSAERRSFET